MIETERLILRQWRSQDRAAWNAMMGDPEVAYWLGGEMTPVEMAASFDRARMLLELDGFGMWAAERKTDGAVIGSVGVRRVMAGHPMAGEVEIGWRLARSAWGSGYASEGAAAALSWGLAQLDPLRIVAFTANTNLRSQAVMERIAMVRSPLDDFEHPALSPEHPLRRHLVYEMRRP